MSPELPHGHLDSAKFFLQLLLPLPNPSTQLPPPFPGVPVLPLVVGPDEAGAIDSQDAVPDGEPAVGGRRAVLDQGADVDPRGAERSVLSAGKGGE